MGDDHLYGKCQKVDNNYSYNYDFYSQFYGYCMFFLPIFRRSSFPLRPDNLKIYEAHVAWHYLEPKPWLARIPTDWINWICWDNVFWLGILWNIAVWWLSMSWISNFPTSQLTNFLLVGEHFRISRFISQLYNWIGWYFHAIVGFHILDYFPLVEFPASQANHHFHSYVSLLEGHP